MITLLIVNIVNNVRRIDILNKQKIDEIIEYMLHPKKLPASVILKDISCGEFILIAAFLKYEEHHQGKRITVNELACELDVSIPAVSRMLKNLETRNLVQRETDKDCRRNTLVNITDDGLSLFKDNENRIRNLVTKILEQFTEEEINMMLNLSKKTDIILEKEIKTIQNNI